MLRRTRPDRLPLLFGLGGAYHHNFEVEDALARFRRVGLFFFLAMASARGVRVRAGASRAPLGLPGVRCGELRLLGDHSRARARRPLCGSALRCGFLAAVRRSSRLNSRGREATNASAAGRCDAQRAARVALRASQAKPGQNRCSVQSPTLPLFSKTTLRFCMELESPKQPKACFKASAVRHWQAKHGRRRRLQRHCGLIAARRRPSHSFVIGVTHASPLRQRSARQPQGRAGLLQHCSETPLRSRKPWPPQQRRQ